MSLPRFVAAIGFVAVVGLLAAACGSEDGAGPSSSIAPTTPVTATTQPTTTSPTTTTTSTTTSTTTTTIPPDPTATYELEVVNEWVEADRPVPANAHFSWLAGATHDATVAFWDTGELAGPGIVQMAETGVTDLFVEQLSAVDGVLEVLSWQWWFCAPSTTSSRCGDLRVELTADVDHPYLTLATMIGPSPDWFVGVPGLALMEDGQWRDRIEWVLYPMDGGTRDANRFALGGPQTDPPTPIVRISEESGQMVGPAPIGRFILTRRP